MVAKRVRKHKRSVHYPLVSVCTPTFNRRPFIPSLINCFNLQDYPKDKIEWIIIDDGTDKIEDLVSSIPQVKYYKYDTKMTLGKKRNIMHEKCSGEIIVYMDDDDYYPPTRISHAVETLQKNPKALCSGSSRLHIYFKHLDKIYQFGPYGPNHATAGTFAFKSELLKQTKYNEEASLAEEKEFLKNYTIPFVQLDPIKTILVFSHIHNTFDKKKLLVNANPKFVKESHLKVNMFIKQADLYDFYVNKIDILLKDYTPGDPSMKPDVIEQTKQIEERRRKLMEQSNTNNNSSPQIVITQNGKKVVLSSEQIVDLLKQQQQIIHNLQEKIAESNTKVESLTNEIRTLRENQNIQFSINEKENKYL